MSPPSKRPGGRRSGAAATEHSDDEGGAGEGESSAGSKGGGGGGGGGGEQRLLLCVARCLPVAWLVRMADVPTAVTLLRRHATSPPLQAACCARLADLLARAP